MPALLDLCKEEFGTSNLYEVFGVKATASSNEVKKGYHRVSLKVHPDRSVGDKEDATRKFQTLGRIYQILSDADLRAVYDETGEIPEENSTLGENSDWNKYWRNLFPKITSEDIAKFAEEYIGSENELKDLEAAYNEGEGDMDHIIDTVLLCTVDDEERFREIIDEWIEEGRVESYSSYTKETKKKKNKRKRKAAREAQEAEVAKNELGLGDTPDDLKSLILSRGKNRAAEMDSFLDNLANKYSKPKKNKKK